MAFTVRGEGNDRSIHQWCHEEPYLWKKSTVQLTAGVMAGGSLFVDVGLMLVEGRVAERQNSRGHKEGPHCPQLGSSALLSVPPHNCSDLAFLCERAAKLKRHMSLLSDNSVPMCIDVFLCPDCPCGQTRALASNICSVPSPTDLLLEQWTVSLITTKGNEACEVDGKGLLQAIRSQLHFSQLSSWYSLGMVKPVCYRLSHPGTARSIASFSRPPNTHHFPIARTHRGTYVKVSVKSLPRMEGVSNVSCPMHANTSHPTSTVTVCKPPCPELGHCLLDPPSKIPPPIKHGLGTWRDNRTPSPPARSPRSYQRTRSSILRGLVDDRLQSGCQHIGKHHCQDDSTELHHESFSKLFDTAVEKDCQIETSALKYLRDSVHIAPEPGGPVISVFRSEVCCKVSEDGGGSTTGEGSGHSEWVVVSALTRHQRINPLKRKRQQLNHSSKKLLSEEQHTASGADLVHSFNSLNLGSEFVKPQASQGKAVRGIPVPTRRPQLIIVSPSSSPVNHPRSLENSRQVTDSSSEDTECESPVTVVPPRPAGISSVLHSISRSPPLFRKSAPLLGSIEESILNGRVKALSVVDCGYTLDLGASGTFCPRHLTLPVTVSFYPVLGLSAPYMGVVKLSKKGYHVPRSGTIQATLLNPLGTVIKMFVVSYDLTDMPANSHTFLRQRILTVPAAHLRYLIHLRFSSSKSGRVFLHSDIRVVIARQYDMDTSMELDIESGCQLRSVNVEPFNPKYSTRK